MFLIDRVLFCLFCPTCNLELVLACSVERCLSSLNSFGGDRSEEACWRSNRGCADVSFEEVFLPVMHERGVMHSLNIQCQEEDSRNKNIFAFIGHFII